MNASTIVEMSQPYNELMPPCCGTGICAPRPRGAPYLRMGGGGRYCLIVSGGKEHDLYDYPEIPSVLLIPLFCDIADPLGTKYWLCHLDRRRQLVPIGVMGTDCLITFKEILTLA